MIRARLALVGIAFLARPLDLAVRDALLQEKRLTRRRVGQIVSRTRNTGNTESHLIGSKPKLLPTSIRPHEFGTLRSPVRIQLPRVENTDSGQDPPHGSPPTPHPNIPRTSVETV